MKELFEIGSVVVSTQGYDKSKLYVILKVQDNFVYLIDGMKKDTSNPKYKNIKHLKPLNLFFDFKETTPKNINQKVYQFIKTLQKNEKSL